MKKNLPNVPQLAALLLTIVLVLSACSSSKTVSEPSPTQPAAGSATAQPATVQPTEAPKAENKDPIILGGTYGLTGPAGIYGTNMRDAAQLVVDEVNAAGGINGRQIKFIVYDDETKSDKAVENTIKLLESDKVFSLVGFTSTPVVAATAHLASEAKVPSTIMSGGYIIKPEEKYIFGTVHPPEPVLRGVMLKLKEKGLKKIAILNADDALGQNSTGVIKKLVAEYGLSVITEEKYKNTDVDVTAQLTKIKGTKPDVLISWATGSPMALVVNNAKQVGLDVPIVVSNGNGINQILGLLKGVANDRVIIPSGPSMAWQDLPDTNASKKLLEAFNTKFKAKTGNNPDYTAAIGYDAMKMTVEAIKAVGTDREKVRDFLETFNGPSVLGTYKRSAADHNGLAPEELFMMTIRDGKFGLLK